MQPNGREPLAEEPSLGEPQVLVVSGGRVTAAKLRAQAADRRRLMSRVSKIAAAVAALSIAAIAYALLR